MKNVLMTMLFIGMMGSIMAQEDKRGERRAMIEQKRIAYVNENAGLEGTQAERYWTIVKEMKAEKKAIKKDSPRKKDINLDSLNDKEAEAIIRDRLSIKKSLLAVEEKYLPNLISAIGAKKLMEVQKAERDFKRDMLHSLKQRRGEMDGPRRPGGK